MLYCSVLMYNDCYIVVKGPKATGAHYRCAFGRKSFVRGLAPPIVRTANQTRTLCVLKQWFSVLTLCSPTHGFSNKCLFCNARRWLSTLSPIYKLKTVDISYSSVLHLLTRLQWTRRFGRLTYEDLAPKTFMKTSFQRTFDPKSSQG